MYFSNSLTEYKTILPIRVTGGPEDGFLLLHALRVCALTPRKCAALLSLTYLFSALG